MGTGDGVEAVTLALPRVSLSTTDADGRAQKATDPVYRATDPATQQTDPSKDGDSPERHPSAPLRRCAGGVGAGPAPAPNTGSWPRGCAALAPHQRPPVAAGSRLCCYGAASRARSPRTKGKTKRHERENYQGQERGPAGKNKDGPWNLLERTQHRSRADTQRSQTTEQP